jgi:hypothetical protein
MNPKNIHIGIVAGVICGLLALAFYFCANPNKDPGAVLNRFLESDLHGKSKEAYKYLSLKDKQAKPIGKYISERASSGKMSSFRKVLYSKISFRIANMKFKDGKMYAEVVVTTPDFGVMFRDLYAAAFGSLGQEALGDRDMDKLLAERYKDSGVPMTEVTRQYVLVREDREWKVFLGLSIGKPANREISDLLG